MEQGNQEEGCMVSDFRASNSAEVAVFSMSLQVSKADREDWLEPWMVVALREFFQQERDEALGRWRPEGRDDVWVLADTDNPNRALIVSDKLGTFATHVLDGDTLKDDNSGWGGAVVRDYFDAHPERKPWDDAQRDEVWLFAAEGNGRALAWRAHDGWDVIDQRGNYHRGITDVPAEMVAQSFYGWENATAQRLAPVSDA